VAKTLDWNDEGQSVNSKGEPDGEVVEVSYMDGDREVVERVRRGRFQIASIRDVESGRVEWFLSEGPLDRAPAPCDSLEEAKALAQAIVDGTSAFRRFEADRTQRRAESLTARRLEARRASYGTLLGDDVFMAELRKRLEGGR